MENQLRLSVPQSGGTKEKVGDRPEAVIELAGALGGQNQTQSGSARATPAVIFSTTIEEY
jgi:hypothetical protein